MIHSININLFFEVLTRLFIWFLFIWYDHTDPFIRDIPPEEVWLYSFPPTLSYVSSNVLWIIILIFPTIICIIDYILTNDSSDSKKILAALTFSYPLNGLVTSVLKSAVGRPRPDFIRRCFPKGGTGDFANCTGLRHVYLDGRKSFPSGHASFAFVCMMFMSLYFASKFKFNTRQALKMTVCFAPVFVASLIAVSRTCDYHHHYQDVAVGSVLGSTIAYFTFKAFFPKQPAPPVASP